MTEEQIAFVLEKLALVGVMIGFSLAVAAYSTWAERKVAAFLQDRLGPNRAGIFGLLQPLADGLKLFSKEEITPKDANKFLFILGPALAMIVACMTGAVIPWSTPFEIGDRIVVPQIADINIGFLYILGVLSLGVYGIMLGAWASNNKYSLMGGLRAASQIISYELPMGLVLITILMFTGSLKLSDIVAQQQDGFWFVILQPLGFLIFLICSFAETNRTPFDLPEAENELIGGYHSEYSSMKMGFFLFAEYINMFISSTIIATIYFGGYDIPFVNDVALGETIGANWLAILHFATLFGKACFFIFFYMWVRWTIPRFRYDQLMDLGWKKLLPLALINMLITGLVILLMNN
ncbi:NADH-quinone oxidoreductase subunit NuoH [Faecalibacter bovis]|uniref:NADH-quinone oxidoreductase subunit H n=1 Tax=Faecalibacter bovis TaxID=2898187 RepID=A0ABX7XG06_9FLAO|nr:NADH-quinone oxidoreductase subunit NuoH [Faecalibacter bovis]MBS7332612.1 NADH-quinone oxidoreductase subunit NuoH [Weeksellaceae bacterium]QTV06800.1 NADH-quinone oxidoreductase subunit NuoH [Faecalibacter bovis]